MKQLKLFEEKTEKEHGGSLRKGKRKVARPLDSRMPIHFILKATRSDLLLSNQQLVSDTNRKFCERFGITTYKMIVHEDHIHFVLKIANRGLYYRWVRSLTGVLVRKIAGLSWKQIPYTRVASWGRDFENLLGYLNDNQLEVDFAKWAEEYVAQYESRTHAEIDTILTTIGATRSAVIKF